MFFINASYFKGFCALQSIELCTFLRQKALVVNSAIQTQVSTMGS
jgi:hypothetical protein